MGYDIENREGAEVLSAARLEMQGQGVPEDIFLQMQRDVPVDDNFFACAEVQRWRTGFASYVWPANGVFADGFREPAILDLPEGTRLDVERWADLEDLAGYPVPPGMDPVEVMRARMGDGGPTVAGLIEGLGRPESQSIPSRRQLLDLADGDPMVAQMPAMSGVYGFVSRLGIHLRAAALTGDRQRVVDLFSVMSKLSAGIGDDPLLTMLLVSAAMDGVTLKALQQGLQCEGLTEEDYNHIQQVLTKVQDLKQVRRAMQFLVVSHHVFHEKLAKITKGEVADRDRFWQIFARDLQWMETLYQRGPRGWLDFNHAAVLNSFILMSGDEGEEGWRRAVIGIREVFQDISTKTQWFGNKDFWIPNPRKLLAAVEIPAFSGIWQSAAKNLFMRRSAVLTCALQRHRLQHGSFPEELGALNKAFLPEPVLDPACAGRLLNYRPTEKGFVVWSVGEDRKDDGADAGLDWIWVQEG